MSGGTRILAVILGVLALGLALRPSAAGIEALLHADRSRVAARIEQALSRMASYIPHPAQAGEPALRLVKTVLTAHGNAAGLAWSDDGAAVFLADEEGRMSATRIDVAAPARPRITATQGGENFLWAVAQRAGLLVFQPSLGNETLRLDPRSLAVVWRRRTGESHAVATDGSRVYVAVEGKPAALVVLDAGGREIGRTAEPDGWSKVYGTAYAGGVLGVAASGDAGKGVPGGIYLYDVHGRQPLRRGRIPRPASDIAMRGARLWTQDGPTLETWEIQDPAQPRRAGVWQQPVQAGPGGTRVRLQFGALAANRTGTRLYAAYRYVTAQGGNDVPDWLAGFMIFDVTGDTPRLIAVQDGKVSGPYRLIPTGVAISPDGGTLAVSYWRYGVRLFSVRGDRIVPEGGVATAGEAHDVYVDGQGILYVFANETMQIIDPRSGQHLNDLPLVSGGDGGWRPFRDGAIVVPGPAATILKLAGGGIQFQQTLAGFGSYTWSVAFDGTSYLYQGDEAGRIHVDQVSVAANGTYNVVEVGAVQVPAVGSGANPLLALALQGPTLWALGPNAGLAAVDVSTPSAPKVVYQDRFTFATNGNHAGLVIAQNRVYAGAGGSSLRIYNPSTLKMTGAIAGFDVNFLDVVGSTYLVLANYWQTTNPEGVYLYDISQNPDAPLLVDYYPKSYANANFRARAVGTKIYDVPLWGVAVLQTP